MFEAKQDNLTLFVHRTSLLGDVAVGVSFATDLNSCCLNKLKGACTCECFPVGSEEAHVCYSMYLVIQNLLCGSPLATARSKVGAVDCGIHNGKFSICWKVKGNISAIRKSLGIALKGLNPGKMFAIYSHCMKASERSPNREEFNFVADKIVTSLKKGITCGVVGSVKLADKEAATKKDGTVSPAVSAVSILKTMLDVLVKKCDIEPVKGTKKAPKDHTPCDHTDKTEIKVNGWQTYVVQDYISAKVKGLLPVVCNKYLLLHIKPPQWKTLAGKMKKYVDDYVTSKYEKVGDNLTAVMGYIMLSNAYVCTDDVYQMIKSDIKPSDIKKAISGAL